MEPTKSLKGAWALSPTAPAHENRDFDGVDSLVPHSLSLPGFKTFLIQKSSLLRRVIWFCVFVISLGLSAFQIAERVGLFLQYPVSTSFGMTSNPTFRFPQLTVCLFNPHATTKFSAFLNTTNYRMSDVYDILKLPGMTLEDIWEMMTEDFDKLILECKFGTSKSCMSPEYWSMDNYVSGRCHVLTINDDVPNLGIETSMKIIIRDHVNKLPDVNPYIFLKVSVSEVNPVNKYRTFMHGINLFRRARADCAYWRKEYTYENTPVHPCVQPHEYDDCMLKCYEEQFYKNRPKCRLPFTAYGLRYPPCNYEEFISMYNFSLVDTFKRFDISGCNCVRSCHDVSYDSKSDLREGNGDGNVTLIFYPGSTNVETMYEMRAYSYLSLASDIGGALGLFLGACILNFFEIFNLTFHAIAQRFHRIIPARNADFKY